MMCQMLGTSSTIGQDELILGQVSLLRHCTILLIGDSTIRNQFMQLARVGLSFNRAEPAARSIACHRHTGSISLPVPIRNYGRPDCSNGFWGGFPWLLASTPSNLTIAYAKIWGCAELSRLLYRMQSVVGRHREGTGMGGWPPELILWNFGLHLLHVYPPRPVPITSLRCALGYGHLLSESAHILRAALPSSRLMFRTTNAVCDVRFDGAWASAAQAFRCLATDSRSAKCDVMRNGRILDLCQRRYNMSSSQCSDTFMDERNTRAQRTRALEIFQAHTAMVEVMDAFQLTVGRCDATLDGRHYLRLLSDMNSRWLASVLFRRIVRQSGRLAIYGDPYI